jgi:localization factor PodJL
MIQHRIAPFQVAATMLAATGLAVLFSLHPHPAPQVTLTPLPQPETAPTPPEPLPQLETVPAAPAPIAEPEPVTPSTPRVPSPLPTVVAPPARPAPPDGGQAEKILAKARSGDAASQEQAGELYAAGDGVAKSAEKAASWFREAAINGVVEAQFRLAQLYRDGVGVKRNPAEALIWYRTAAEHEHPWAQLELGRLYEAGEIVQRDPAEAARWYYRAARQGLPEAARALAGLFERGDGAPRSPVEAYAWYSLAAAAGDETAGTRRAAIAAKLSDAELGAGDKRASDLAAEQAAFAAAPQRLVRDIQHLLAAAGYDPGPDDGRMGDRTEKAIRRFQSEHGMTVDGLPSEALLIRLKAGHPPPVAVAK